MYENFRYRNFLKHRRVPQRIFLALWDEKFPTENCDTPHLLSINFYPYKKTSETQKGSPTNFFGTVRQKVLNDKPIA